MSADSKKGGLAGGIKGLLLVVCLGIAYLVQQMTGIDILGKLQGNGDGSDGTVAEAQEDDRNAQAPGDEAEQDTFRIPEKQAAPQGPRDKPGVTDRVQTPDKPKAAPKQPEKQPDPQPSKGGAFDLKQNDDGAAFVKQQFDARRSKVWVKTEGEVVHLLPDDNHGSRHQLFLIELSNRMTIKVSHNIDDAPYLTGLRKGDRIKLQGRYEWNEKGGVIHFTHKADRPSKRKPGGWIEWKGKRYQ